MMLRHASDLTSKLKNAHLLLDTNVFLHAVNNKEFYNLLIALHEAGCAFLTIPPVVFEFARGAKSIEEFNWYVDFVNNLGVSVYKNAEDQTISDKAFAVLLQTHTSQGKKGISYTDFLLLMLLHKFAHTPDTIYLMTSNYQDVPLSIFDRSEIMALEFDGGVQTQALYRNSPNKLAALTAKL